VLFALQYKMPKCERQASVVNCHVHVLLDPVSGRAIYGRRMMNQTKLPGMRVPAARCRPCSASDGAPGDPWPAARGSRSSRITPRIRASSWPSSLHASKHAFVALILSAQRAYACICFCFCFLCALWGNEIQVMKRKQGHRGYVAHALCTR
jgi:hypothetical protein